MEIARIPRNENHSIGIILMKSQVFLPDSKLVTVFRRPGIQGKRLKRQNFNV